MHAYLLYENRAFDFKTKVSDTKQQILRDLEGNDILDAMGQMPLKSNAKSTAEKTEISPGKNGLMSGKLSQARRGNRMLRESCGLVIAKSCDKIEDIVYRQNILKDCMASEELIRALDARLSDCISVDKDASFDMSRKKAKYMMDLSIGVWTQLVPKLKELMDVVGRLTSVCQSQGLCQLLTFAQRIYSIENLEQVLEMTKTWKNTNDVWVITGAGRHLKPDTYILTKDVAGRQGLKKLLSKVKKTGKSFTVDETDEETSPALTRLRDAMLKDSSDAIVRAKEETMAFLKEWKQELAFYIGCLNLKRALEPKGINLCFPAVLEQEEYPSLEFKTLYNTSLALQKEENVPNTIDCRYKRMIVVTGSNQGGKTTWLRALGQAIVMMQCGMFVCAEEFRGNLCQVYTHFIREEDDSLKSGKLDEELLRMSDLLAEMRAGDLLLMNESFSSTNEEEGSDIAMEITSALIEEGVNIAYVTHFYRLVQMLAKEESADILFLNASRREDGRRTFELKEGKPEVVGYGQDLYREIFE